MSWRIPETDIERVKRETDLQALVQSRGVELKKHGPRFIANAGDGRSGFGAFCVALEAGGARAALAARGRVCLRGRANRRTCRMRRFKEALGGHTEAEHGHRR